MRLLFIVPLLALAACNAKTEEVVETQSCSYDIPKNTKTCDLTEEERAELASTLVSQNEATPVGRTTYNNQPYTVMSDGTLKPEKK